jgi:Holliday junction DNA helicase RuvB
MADLQKACALEQLDNLGLGPLEQKYLWLLMEGPKRVNVLASMLGVPKPTLSSVTEPFLLRAGLLTKDDSSRRVLTPEGRRHLLENGPEITQPPPSEGA